MRWGRNGIGEVKQGTGRQDEGLRGRVPFSAAAQWRGGRKAAYFQSPLTFSSCQQIWKTWLWREIFCITCTCVTHTLLLTQPYILKNMGFSMQKIATGKSLLAQSIRQGMQMSESEIWTDTWNCITFNPEERCFEKGLEFKHGRQGMQNPTWSPSWTKQTNGTARTKRKHLFCMTTSPCCTTHSLLSRSLLLKIFHCRWEAFCCC